ncbi:unnamed protein product, partial [Mesorhabditis spiculigera]
MFTNLLLIVLVLAGFSLQQAVKQQEAELAVEKTPIDAPAPFASYDIDMCNYPFEAVHADMLAGVNSSVTYRLSTEKCGNKLMNAHCLQPLLGHSLEAWKGELDTGEPIVIAGCNYTTTYANLTGPISIRITRLQSNASSYHQLMSTLPVNSYNLMPVAPDPSQKLAFDFTKDGQTYVLYQTSKDNSGYNGIFFDAPEGDCETLMIWKSLYRGDETKLYGGNSTFCRSTVPRDGFPDFVANRYMIFETHGTKMCRVAWSARYLDQSTDHTFKVRKGHSGVLNSPPYSGSASIPGDFVTVYQLQKEDLNNEKSKIHLQLLSPVLGASTLTIFVESTTQPIVFNASNGTCDYNTSEAKVWIQYNWSCTKIPCEKGMVLKYSLIPSSSDERFSLLCLLVTMMVSIFYWC